VVPTSATPLNSNNALTGVPALSPKQPKKFYLKKGDILDTYLEKTQKYLPPQPPLNPDDQYVWKRM